MCFAFDKVTTASDLVLKPNNPAEAQTNSPGMEEIMWRKIIGFAAPICVVARSLVSRARQRKESKISANGAN